MNKKGKALTIIIAALFTAMFAVSIYYLALYPTIKDSSVQKAAKEKYASAYNLASGIFAPFGIGMYSYDEYESMQMLGVIPDEQKYKTQIQPVIQPDISYSMLIQEKDLEQFTDQTDSMLKVEPSNEAPVYNPPEDFLGRQLQFYDFVLKDDRLTPYYERMKEKRRNDMPIIRIYITDAGIVMRAIVILQHQPDGDGSTYWPAGTPGEDIINSIIAIYESKPEIFRDYDPSAEAGE